MPVIEKNGLNVEVRQSGRGPDLLLLHSLLTEMTVFERVLPSLEEAHRVTRINLPGFGASAPVALETVAAHADHVAKAMDALDLPADTDVFGNGFGAFVVLELAIRHGGQFNRLLVADVVPAFPEAARVPFRGMAGKVSATGMQAVLDTAIGRMFPPAFQAEKPGEASRLLICIARAKRSEAGKNASISMTPIRDIGGSWTSRTRRARSSRSRSTRRWPKWPGPTCCAPASPMPRYSWPTAHTDCRHRRRSTSLSSPARSPT